MDFVVPTDSRVKLKESEKRDKYQNFARERKKTMYHESVGDSNCNWYSHKRNDKGIGGLGNKRSIGDHPKNSNIKIGQNTRKSPGNLRSTLLHKFQRETIC